MIVNIDRNTYFAYQEAVGPDLCGHITDPVSVQIRACVESCTASA